MYIHLDPVRFVAVYYELGDLPAVDRRPRAICTDGRHKRQNEIRKKSCIGRLRQNGKIISYESAKILDTCVPRLINIQFITIFYILII